VSFWIAFSERSTTADLRQQLAAEVEELLPRQTFETLGTAATPAGAQQSDQMPSTADRRELATDAFLGQGTRARIVAPVHARLRKRSE
jgi:hypothetical protein